MQICGWLVDRKSYGHATSLDEAKARSGWKGARNPEAS
jgi:hypothetical protein